MQNQTSEKNLPDNQQESTAKSQNPTKPAEKKENFWVNLIFNIAVPSIILSKFSDAQHLGPTLGLIIALIFPIGYGLMDFFTRKKINIFSILGLISTLLTGTISLLQLPPEYIAIKEAAIPAILFVVILVSTWTPYRLVEKIIFNDNLFDLEKLHENIASDSAKQQLSNVLDNSSYLVSFSFLISSLLNYGLAKYIVVSNPGTAAYNEELGKMMSLSYPVIALPCTVLMMGALFYLIIQLQKITGKDIEEFLLTGK